MSTHANRRKETKRQLRREEKRAEARAGAEAVHSYKREARLRKAERRETARLVAAKALANANKSSRFRTGLEGAWSPGILAVLKEMSLDRSERFQAILAAVEDRAPKLAEWAFSEPLARLAYFPWVRDIKDWAPRGKAAASMLRSMAEHLFCRYRTPPFLFSAIERKGAEVSTLLNIFVMVGSGQSIFKAVEDGIIPVKLTKKMCHEFLQAKAGTDVLHAMRNAQVRCNGGDRKLAAALCETAIGRVFHQYEDFWATVIQWFCSQGMVDPAEIGPMIDYLEAQRRADPLYSMKGRTASAMLKHMRTWHRDLAQARGWSSWKPASFEFKPSGFTEAQWDLKKKDANGQQIVVRWFIEEILSIKDLLEEGKVMKHCVYSYGPRIESGSTSIWRMWKIEEGTKGERCLTVEVNNGTRAVVQARGICNRRPISEEERILAMWSQQANLSVSLSGW